MRQLPATLHIARQASAPEQALRVGLLLQYGQGRLLSLSAPAVSVLSGGIARYVQVIGVAPALPLGLARSRAEPGHSAGGLNGGRDRGPCQTGSAQSVAACEPE